MKKIIFALFALSSLSFAAQTFPTLESASIPINVSAVVSGSPATQIMIVGENDLQTLASLDITHQITKEEGAIKGNSETANFRVIRGSEGKVLIGNETVSVHISTTDITLGDGKLSTELSAPSVATKSSDPTITNPVTVTSSLVAVTSAEVIAKNIIDGLYNSDITPTLTVTYDKK